MNKTQTEGLKMISNSIGGKIRDEVLARVSDFDAMTMTSDIDEVLEKSAKANVRGHFNYFVEISTNPAFSGVTEDNLLDTIEEFGMDVIMRNAQYVTRSWSFIAKVMEDLEGEAWAGVLRDIKSLRNTLARLDREVAEISASLDPK